MPNPTPPHRSRRPRRAARAVAVTALLALPWALPHLVAGQEGDPRSGEDPRRRSPRDDSQTRFAQTSASIPGGSPPGITTDTTADPLARSLAALGIPVTGGAAPGYVPDGTCANCHRELYESYQEVGMARSFFRPRPERSIEDFEHARYVHEPSGRHYEMSWQDGALVFSRWIEGPAGERRHEFETEVDWVLGSGHTSRTYLYRTPSRENGGGEMYQLPIAWYSQERAWAMAPGFDRPDHQGVLRQVHRECMFCHNAYPDVPAGSDLHDAAPLFPEELPEGTGCQRCHGPGARHVDAASGGMADPATVRRTIVNPGKLDKRLLDDVCHQCHLQPSVALFGAHRLGRSDYSYRPGEPLTDYVLKVDLVEEGRSAEERFEINHHPYRLEQSRCFESGEMSCLTCHDPHRKVPPETRAAHYRAACLTCHQVDACGLDEMTAEAAAGLPAVAPSDCVACHMPKRRTQDVVHVVMTDHKIRKTPGGPELTAPLSERSDPVILDLSLHDERAPSGAEGELYRALTAVRSAGGASAVDRLAQMLKTVRPEEVEPYLALGRGQLATRRFADAAATFRAILASHPGHPDAGEWLGLAQAAQGQGEQALATLTAAARARPDRPEARFNLGRVLVGYGRPAEALPELRAAVALRPVMAPAWYYLGQAHERLGRRDEAIDAYRRTLVVDPSFERAAAALGRLLSEPGTAGDLR